MQVRTIEMERSHWPEGHWHMPLLQTKPVPTVEQFVPPIEQSPPPAPDAPQ